MQEGYYGLHLESAPEKGRKEEQRVRRASPEASLTLQQIVRDDLQSCS